LERRFFTCPWVFTFPLAAASRPLCIFDGRTACTGCPRGYSRLEGL
jgi:hypothetical protein